MSTTPTKNADQISCENNMACGRYHRKVEQKALPFDGALIQKDLKDHEGEQ